MSQYRCLDKGFKLQGGGGGETRIIICINDLIRFRFDTQMNARETIKA